MRIDIHLLRESVYEMYSSVTYYEVIPSTMYRLSLHVNIVYKKHQPGLWLRMQTN